jgi:hypothetical protein
MGVTLKPLVTALRDGVGSVLASQFARATAHLEGGCLVLASSQFAPATASCDHAPEDVVGFACDEAPCSLPDRGSENNKAVAEAKQVASGQVKGDCTWTASASSGPALVVQQQPGIAETARRTGDRLLPSCARFESELVWRGGRDTR